MAKAFNDNSGVTANSQQIELLKKLFPQCFDKHGAFMADKLQAIVGDSGTAFSKESYRLNWLGKSYARLLANENPLTFLSEDKTHNQKPEHRDSENLLIKGDNLEVLKHLKQAYAEQVKMIYIDPPYNTGSDGFVYQDDRKFTPNELSRLAGIDVDEAQRILDFTQSKANSHSAWLTFMYPRLYVARELLKDDGVIFISIDDNEVAQLRILCDEVFGEESFLTQLIWKKSYGGGAKSKHTVVLHEYVLMYAKQKDLIGEIELPSNDEVLKYYKFKDEKFEQRGPYRKQPLATNSMDSRPNLRFPIKFGKHEIWPDKQWQWSQNRVEQAIQNDELVFTEKSVGWTVDYKQYLKDEDGKVRGSKLYSLLEGPYTQIGTNEIKDIFGEGKVFSFPKPSGLIKHILGCFDEEFIVLDFFAGSGTTAHAVMALNAQDNGKRKFILVQIPEPCDKKSEAYKAGYQTIVEITQARIEKAAAKIKSENPDYQGDLGFKLFETVPLPDGYLEEVEKLDSPNFDLFDGSILDDKQLEDLLTTWKVYDGIALTAPLTPIDLAGYTGWQQQKILYLVHKDFSTQALTALLQKLDDTEDKTFDIERLVLFAHNFDSKHQREISEALKQYQNRKQKSVSVELRY